METIHEAEIVEASPSDEQGATLHGLADSIATEHSAGPGAAGSGGSATPGKRPGRPPIHGLYSKAAGSDGKHPASPNGQAEFPPVEMESDLRAGDLIPPELLTQVIQETLTSGEAYAQSKIENVALAAGLTQADIVAQLRQAHLSPAKKELIGRLTPLAAQEWNMSIENLSPSGVILALLAPTALAATSAYLTLAKLAVERQAKGLSTKANGEKPGGNSGNSKA
jgi:hypothetical protein